MRIKGSYCRHAVGILYLNGKDIELVIDRNLETDLDKKYLEKNLYKITDYIAKKIESDNRRGVNYCSVHIDVWLFDDICFMIDYLAERLEIGILREFREFGAFSYWKNVSDHFCDDPLWEDPSWDRIIKAGNEGRYSDVIGILEEYNIERMLR